jgi:hypothetical protein
MECIVLNSDILLFCFLESLILLFYRSLCGLELLREGLELSKATPSRLFISQECWEHSSAYPFHPLMLPSIAILGRVLVGLVFFGLASGTSSFGPNHVLIITFPLDALYGQGFIIHKKEQ